MRKIIRDKTSDILLIISFVISFIVILNLIPMVDGFHSLYEKTSQYNYEIWLSITGCEDDTYVATKEDELRAKAFFTLLTGIEQGNVILCTDCLAVDDSWSINSYLVLRENESFKLNTDADVDAGIVYLNEKAKDYVKDNQVTIGGRDFMVAGIYEEYEASDEDIVSATIFVNRMSEEEQEVFKEQIQNAIYTSTMMLRLCSNQELQTTYEELQEKISQLGFQYEVVDMEEAVEDIDEIYYVLNKCVLCGATVLAILNCMQVSVLWMARRRKEYAIRKAFGYSTGQILREIFISMMSLGAMAAAITVVLQCVYLKLIGDSTYVSEHVLLQLAISVASMTAVVVVTMVKPYVQLREIEPVQGISKWQ